MLKPSKKKIAFAGPWVTDKEEKYVIDAVHNGFYETYDKHTKLLEEAVTSYLGVKYGLATHCCTVALHLACSALDLKEGDEVICTDFSWIATAYAITYTGAKPVFVDIEPDTWCISPSAIKKAITLNTKAIMLVHTFGQPANMSEIMAIAKEYNLKVIEDAAPALGAEHKNVKVGTFGDFGCFSFQGAKLAVSGEGGIIVTNDDALFEKVKLLASMGRTNRKGWFWCDSLGYQYTIGNISAALALAQVERIEELLEKKRNIFNWYHSGMKHIPGIKWLVEPEGSKGNYCYPSFVLEKNIAIERDDILKKLKELNIHCRPGFMRMSQFPVYSAANQIDTPVAESIEKRGISLASAFNLTQDDVGFVCQAIESILNGAI